jgi:hypothetical protein
MRLFFRHFVPLLLLMIVLAGCGGNPLPPAPTSTGVAITPTTESAPTPLRTEVAPNLSPTSDPCSTDQIEAAVQNVHRHMREFDDASILASNMPREELSDSIAELQRIRREAEDEQIPTCLIDLKTHQVDHMNSVISTLIAFIGGADTNTLGAAITTARDQHDQYTLELARLLGLTVVPATVPVISTPAETAAP